MPSLHRLKGAAVIVWSAGKDFSLSSVLRTDALPGEMCSSIAHSTLGLLLREAKAALAMPPAMLEDLELRFWTKRKSESKSACMVLNLTQHIQFKTQERERCGDCI